MDVIKENEGHKVRELDKDVKNKFKFSWLERKVIVGEGENAVTIVIGDDIVKINLAGQWQCFCKHESKVH